MTRKSWIINELNFDNIASITPSYIDDNDTTQSVTFTAEQIKFACRSYYDYTFIDYTGSLKNEVLKINFAKWYDLNSARISRIFRALNENYNPTENYLKHGNIETTYGQIVTNDIEGDTHKVTTVPNEITTETQERATDSLNLAVTMKTKTSATANVGGTSTSDAFHDVNTTTNSGKDTIKDTTHGNIGTTLASTMIKEELSIRDTSLLDIICRDFMIENAYYVDNNSIW